MTELANLEHSGAACEHEPWFVAQLLRRLAGLQAFLAQYRLTRFGEGLASWSRLNHQHYCLTFIYAHLLLEGAKDFDNNGTIDLFLRHRGVGQGLLWSIADSVNIASEQVISNVPTGVSQVLV